MLAFQRSTNILKTIVNGSNPLRFLCSNVSKDSNIISNKKVRSKGALGAKNVHITKQADPSQSYQLLENKVLGQPTHYSHPHLLNDGEIAPFITKEEFQNRRRALVDSVLNYVSKKVNNQSKNHFIVIPAASKLYMSDKIPYFFRQNSDFYYLTGCSEPDCCLVISTLENSSEPKATLFMRDRDEHSEVWDGPRTRPDDAINFFGVDQALPMSELLTFTNYFFRTAKVGYLWYDFTQPLQIEVQKSMEDILKDDSKRLWESPRSFIQRLRMKKSPAEIQLMTKSCEIASQAISSTMECTKPGITEHELYAKVDYECRVRGANHLAYPPVVASGHRANVIHYINNNQMVKDGELILMDAGCEYYGYCSDITRTWPANGKFTREQRELYEIVLSVQLDLIEMCEGFPTLDSLFDTMCLLLGKRLQSIGLISKFTSGESLMRQAYQFCPHHVSHYLGMDVHDTPSIPRNISIQPGMVFTIEPGVYISDKHRGVIKDFIGLGVRIEDDILMTERGPVVLTQSCPKEIDDIEKIAARALKNK